MNKSNIILITVISVVFLILTYGAYVISGGGKNPEQIVNYTNGDQNKPHVVVKQATGNLGTMRVADRKSFDFTISNTGTEPLQLYNMTSSCSCTAGQVIANDSESAEYGMHAQSDYITAIKPGGKGVVRVIYRPFIMPLYGKVEREVFVSTNDPKQPKLTFTVTAFVQ